MPRFSRQLPLTTVSASALVLTLASYTRSKDLIVDGPFTGTQSVDGVTYDTIIITGDGSIATAGNDHGVESTADGNTILNNGTILTGGSSASGIFNSGDNVTITNSGDILTSGNNARGVQNRGDNVTILNSGNIRTTGNSASGVNNFNNNNATILNSGDIRTQGNFADGIYNYGDKVTILNSGDIRTQGNFADGVYNYGDNVTITNSGDIRTTGSNSDGIYNYGEYVTILNSGDIRTTRNRSTGITNENGHNATITNSGEIRTEGKSAHGIVNSRNQFVVITNAGDIRTTGEGAHGIWNYYGYDARIANSGNIRTSGDDAPAFDSYYSSGTEFTNSGVIISEQSDAIRVGQGSDGSTVNLNAPGYLGGAISFESETTLNITTGASHSVLWQLPATNVAGGEANVSGPVPWFYDSTTGQFATFDPTGLTASFNQMANTANMLGRLGRYGLRQAGRSGAAGTSSAALAHGGDGTQSSESFDVLLATNSGPESAYGLKTGAFWLTGFGGNANHDGDDANLDHSIDQIGAALGYAWSQSPHMRLGFMAGYMNGAITAKSTWGDAQDITSNGIFAGVHGDKRFGRLTLGLGLAGGWQTNDSDRFVNDNTATTGGLTLGESTASASYDSWFVTPEAALSADIALGQTGIVLTPSIRGRYALQQTGSYTETGSAANATVDSHTFGVLEGDFELAVSRSFGLATVSGRAGYLVRSSAGDDDVPVTLLGLTNSIGLGETDRSAAYLGAALDLNLGPQASFTLDGQGYLSDDVDALQGMARLAIRF